MIVSRFDGRGGVWVVLALFAGLLVMVPGAVAEADRGAAGKETADDSVVIAEARAHIRAAADGRAGGALLLCIGSTSQVDSATLHRASVRSVARPWDVVVTPMLELGLAERAADKNGGDGGDEPDARQRALGVALIERALAAARERQDIHDSAPLRVMVVGDGMRIAQDWLRETGEAVQHLLLVQPHTERLVPIRAERRPRPGDEPRERDAGAVPVDVFFASAAEPWLEQQRRNIERVLGAWRHHARIHANLSFADDLEARLAEVRQTLDGVRVHDALDLSEPSKRELLQELLEYDVVVLGETHDNIAFQAWGKDLFVELIAAAQRANRPVALSLEMFERDVQETLDRYLAGEIDEESFLAHSRPWPNYRTGYRGFIEAAREAGADVIAGNVPRRIAARIAREGREALEDMDEQERAFAAAELNDGPGEYRDRFFDVMRQFSGGHGHGHGDAEMDAEQQAHLERMYSAQAIKDDTMAESIAHFFAEHEDTDADDARPLVVHLNGRFHSDYRLGMVERLELRTSQAQAVTITCAPLATWDDYDPKDIDPSVADYVAFAPAPRTAR